MVTMKRVKSLRNRLPPILQKKNENPTVSTRTSSSNKGLDAAAAAAAALPAPARPEQSTTTASKRLWSDSCPNHFVAAATRDENESPPPEQQRDHHGPHGQQRRPLTQQETNDFERISKAAAALDKAGNEMFERGEYAKALLTYTRALKLKRRMLTLGLNGSNQDQKDVLLASVATSINNIGYLRQRSGATADEAMAAYRDALQIKKEILGNENLSVGKTLNNIGSVYFSTKNWDHALEAYLEAHKIMVSNLGNDHMDVATVFSNIGDVHSAKNQGRRAIKCYKEALRIRWTVFGDHDPKCVRLLEKIASIEMAGSPEKIQEMMDVTDLLELTEDDGKLPVDREFRILRSEVKQDIVKIESMERSMALDMVRDKLQMIREMRQLETITKEGYGNSDIHANPLTPVQARTEAALSPLTPVQRHEALSSVKDRLARLRESKSSTKEEKGLIDALRSMNLSKRNLAESLDAAVRKL